MSACAISIPGFLDRLLQWLGVKSPVTARLALSPLVVGCLNLSDMEEIKALSQTVSVTGAGPFLVLDTSTADSNHYKDIVLEVVSITLFKQAGTYTSNGAGVYDNVTSSYFGGGNWASDGSNTVHFVTFPRPLVGKNLQVYLQVDGFTGAGNTTAYIAFRERGKS